MNHPFKDLLMAAFLAAMPDKTPEEVSNAFHDFTRGLRALTDLAEYMEYGLINLDNLHNVNYWNLTRLTATNLWPGRRRFRRPAINLYAKLTSRGNFALEWYPTGFQGARIGRDRYQILDDTDFTKFTIAAEIAEQPYNRLCFIHDADELLDRLCFARDPHKRQALYLIAEAIPAYFKAQAAGLSQAFDVTVVTELRLEQHQGAWRYQEVNIEQEWLAAFEKEYGYPPEEFLTLYKQSRNVHDLAATIRQRRSRITAKDLHDPLERLRKRHAEMYARYAGFD